MAKKNFSEAIGATLTTQEVINDIKTATAQEVDTTQEVKKVQEKKTTKKASTKGSKTAAASGRTRKTYTEKEALEAQENLKTSGRKGVALPRINLAFTPSNYDYIKTMAAMHGVSLTEFVNSIIKKDSETGENAKAYKQVVKLRNSIK